MSDKPITIIGGGVAGLALGIGLRQRRVPVTVLEAGQYPRHKVCGEFISGRGQQTLARLGLTRLLLERSSIPARTAWFYFGNASSGLRQLPVPANCISRYELDAFLACRFRELGGELHERQRVRDAEPRAGLVFANGRRLQTDADSCRWFGVKLHAREVEMAADLEMHSFRNGYIGLCRLRDGRVNVCGLFRASAGAGQLARGRFDLLRGPAGSALNARLKNAAFDAGSFSSVAGLMLRAQRASGREECVIGDALTMIAPVTGNGMSMALEAAEIASGPLVQYSQGAGSWEATRRVIARDCDEVFAPRLRWAGWLQRLMFTGFSQNWLALSVRCTPSWKLLFTRTR